MVGFTKLGTLPHEEVTNEREFGILQTRESNKIVNDSRAP